MSFIIRLYLFSIVNINKNMSMRFIYVFYLDDKQDTKIIYSLYMQKKIF